MQLLAAELHDAVARTQVDLGEIELGAALQRLERSLRSARLEDRERANVDADRIFGNRARTADGRYFRVRLENAEVPIHERRSIPR
jgi:hypothetical protein